MKPEEAAHDRAHVSCFHVSVFRPVVVLPTFNNSRTLPEILRRVEALALPIIVVNDGSTDDTASILEPWSNRATIIAHATNRGKAAALACGFAAASAAG